MYYIDYINVLDNSRIYLGMDNEGVNIYLSGDFNGCKKFGNLVYRVSFKNLSFLEEFVYDDGDESRLVVCYYDEKIKRYILKFINVNLETGIVRELADFYSDIPIVHLDKGLYNFVDTNGLKTIVSGLSWCYNNNHLIKPQTFSKNYSGVDLKIVDFSFSKLEESDLF